MKRNILWSFLSFIMVLTLVAWSCDGTPSGEQEEEEEEQEEEEVSFTMLDSEIHLADYVLEKANFDSNDFDHDGDEDIFLFMQKSLDSGRDCRLDIYKNADQTFSLHQSIPFGNTYPYSLAVEDINGDGLIEIIASSDTLNILTLEGTYFNFWQDIAISGVCSITVEDMNNDGDSDLVLCGYSKRVHVFENDGAGYFDQVWQSEVLDSNEVAESRITDFNEDGNLDIVSLSLYDGKVNIFLGDGTGRNFTNVYTKDFGVRSFALEIGDIDSDGKTDFVVEVGWGKLYVFTNDGDGNSFTQYWLSPDYGYACLNLELYDFTGDGDLDIFCLLFDTGDLYVYENHLDLGTFTLTWSETSLSSGYGSALMDIDGSGTMDIAVSDGGTLHFYINVIP
jgi:hypothetical protein